MGQAWCKEKSSKAQDSKSPLDRVFVRCAHRIYPGLKEEGSVLGGATQRVTSSEIGYAVSPPRSSMLHRGLSIDSVDRPFHPSEWVDVNLEVPCSPRDSVVLTRLSAIAQPEQLQQRASSPSTNSLGSRRPKDEEPAGGTPVPPPRRRRRSRRPLPPEPGPDTAVNNSSSSTPEDDAEEFGHYSQLAAPRPAPPDYEDVASKNSDDEFIAIEESLKKRSLENVSQGQREEQPDPDQIYEKVTKKRDATETDAAAVRPKNHSTASLPNYGKLKPEEDSTSEEKTAERPPRHVKTASLPRDTSLILSSSDSSLLQKTPEATLSGRIEETEAGTAGSDNSILKADGEEEPAFGGRDVKTSTPFKPTAPPLENSVEEEEDGEEDTTEFYGNLDFDSSNETQDHSSSRSFDVSVGRDLVVIEEVVEQQQSPPRNDDPGYETRSTNAGTVSFIDESHYNSELFQDAAEELSSGILRDAVVNGNNSEAPVQLQRSISEESLPREMLVDEVVAVVAEEKKKEEKQDEEQQLDEEKSAKDASNELVRQISANDSDNFKTPPTSPQAKPANEEEQSRGKEEEEESTADKDKSGAKEGNPVSGGTTTTTPLVNLTVQTVADMLPETAPALPTSEPQIIPDVKHQPSESIERDDEFTKKKIDLEPSSTPKNVRVNPFNDSSYDHSEHNNTNAEDAPEKPIRLYRINLFEDQEIENPVIVPTPPRRRHRSKSNLNSSNGKSEVIEALHTYATNDRLI